MTSTTVSRSVCVEGRTVEIGGGIGQFKDRFPLVIATDIQIAPWLDLVADAQRLPFAQGSISNIVMIDVLHHLEFPLLFLREASRVLRPGGTMHFSRTGNHLGEHSFLSIYSSRACAYEERPVARGKRLKRFATPTILIKRFQPCSSDESGSV